MGCPPLLASPPTTCRSTTVQALLDGERGRLVPTGKIQVTWFLQVCNLQGYAGAILQAFLPFKASIFEEELIAKLPMPRLASCKLARTSIPYQAVFFLNAYRSRGTPTLHLFTTRVPAIISCRACFLSVKPAMIKPMSRMSAEMILAKYLPVACPTEIRPPSKSVT